MEESITAEDSGIQGALCLQRRHSGGDIPLSLNQRDMWFQSQIHAEAGLNNVCAQVTLSGSLRHQLFREALQAVVDRHEALRTVFIEQDGAPRQRILDCVHVSFSILDLCAESPDVRAQVVLRREQELVCLPFDFGVGPLFRAELLRLEGNQHVFLFVFNHLILDGIYMAQLFQQVGTAYSMLSGGGTLSLPSISIQYPDFAVWQNARLDRGLLRQHEGYWRQQLELPIPVMDLPTDRDSRRIRGFAVGVLEQEVPSEVFHRLKSFRKRYRTTLFRTVLAAFEVLMQRLVNEKDILLGIPFSTLPPHLPEVLGFFGHAVPIRVNVHGMRFAAVLADVNRQLGEAQLHVEYPLCEALRGLKVDRDPYRPLVPVIISQVRTLDADMAGVQMRLISRFVFGGVYHLWLTVLERADGLSMGFYYNRELLEGRPLALLMDCMKELLSQVAERPDAPVSELEIMPKAEKARVLGFGVGTARTDEGPWVEELIAERARSHPATPAVVDRQTELNYGELNSRANRLANWLLSVGVGREDRIGILGRRGAGMLVTILGVMKAGAAYVPLDPGNPQERLLGMVRDAGMKWLAVGDEFVARGKSLIAGSECGLFSWEDLSGMAAESTGAATAGAVENGSADYTEWNRSSVDEPQREKSSGKDLAYVFFTSGSTGFPKGAMLERTGMLNHLRAKIDALGLDGGDVVVQSASHCFDISVWQFLAALMVGGRVVIYGDDLVMEPVALLEAVRSDGATILEVVPSYLELLLGMQGVGRCLSGLRYLLSTAETLSVSLSRRWFERCGHVKLVNAWGPTECSDDVTHEILELAPGESKERVGVGRPIAGARVYVVDADLNLAPVGCEGEIAVGGMCVGRGYLGNAPGTARVFVPDPFGTREGGRLYLTGDMGRWRWDGGLEFLGRRDGQVKVRGHRVEVGEVEGALSGHPGVSQAVVEIKDGRLVGYWVGETGIAALDFRKYLAERLPEHMVPEVFVRLQKLPLTGNGKVDRRSLPEPDLSIGIEEQYVAPRTEMEKAIADVWQEVLGVKRVGLHDDFFTLGGHSLNATRIVLNLRSRLSHGVSIRQLFLNPTVAELAAALNGEAAQSPVAEVIPRLPEQSAYLLSPAQKPMWLTLHGVLEKEVHGWGFPQIVRMPGEMDRVVLHAALQALIERHDLLRSSFVEIASEPGYVVHKDVEIACPFHDLSSLPDTSQQQRFHQLLAEQLAATMKNQPPLLRAQLVRFNTHSYAFVMQLPHIISDMWTERILVEDLAEIYTSLIEERKPKLPALAVRYADYASWHNQRVNSAALQAHKSYWLERFQDDFPVLQWPQSGSPETRETLVHDRVLHLPKGLMAQLRKLANDEGTTLFVAVLAAFTALLVRITGSLDVVIGTAVSGRTHPDLERVAGLFMNPLALRSTLSGDPTFLEVLELVRHTVLDALVHQDCPFQDWLRELRKQRGRNDLYPYSVVLFVEEATRDLRFAGVEAFLESPPAYDFDVTKVVGPTLALRVSEGPEHWCLELIPGLLQEAPAPPGLLPLLASFLRQVVESPEIRLGLLDLLTEEEHQVLTRFSAGQLLDPTLLGLLSAFKSAGGQDIAALCADGTTMVGSGEMWLDPFALEGFLLRTRVEILVAAAETLVRLKKTCRSEHQISFFGLRHVVLVGLPDEVTISGLACRVSVFVPLGDLTDALLWIDKEHTPGMPVVGWPVGTASFHILDSWGGKVRIGMKGGLFIANEKKQSGQPLIRLPWWGSWQNDGRLELTSKEDLVNAQAQHIGCPGVAAYLAPQTALERQVASVWQKVLNNVEEIGIQDDFFALGGTAEKAVRISLQLGSLNMLALPSRITAHRTIHALSAVIENDTKFILDVTSQSGVPAPMTPLQQFIYRASVNSSALAVGRVVLQTESLLDLDTFSEALRQLAFRHDALRLRFGIEGGLLFAALRADNEPTVVQVAWDPLTSRRCHREWQAMVEAQALTINPDHPSLHAVLGSGPGGKGHKLALLASSLVLDEVSWPVLIDELEDIYIALLSGRSVIHEPRPSFYTWLLIADRLSAFAEPRTTGSPSSSGKPQMMPLQTAHYRMAVSALHGMRHLSPPEQDAVLLAAARAVFSPTPVFPEPVTPDYDRRGSAANHPADLSRTIGQFGCMVPEPGRSEANPTHPGVQVRLLHQLHEARRSHLFRLTHFMPASLAAGAEGIRIVGLIHGGTLHLSLNSARDTGLEQRAALKRLAREVASPGPIAQINSRHFDTLDLDLQELEELLN